MSNDNTVRNIFLWNGPLDGKHDKVRLKKLRTPKIDV